MQPLTEDRVRAIFREELRRTNGRLPFPLDIDTLHALKTGGFVIVGTVTLASGAATVQDRRIQPSSKALVSYDTTANALSSSGTLDAALAQESLTITSTSGTDASDVTYLIIL